MRFASVFTLAAVLAAGAAQAQGIDCTKARTPVERAICASPALTALDRQVGVAYAAAVSRAPDRAAVLRQDTLTWLRARDAACGVPAAQMERCLSGQMTARLQALAAPAQAAPVQAATPAAPPQAAAQAATGQTPVPAPPPPVAALPRVPDSANPPAPAATVEPASLRAAEQADALLRVTSPGRFTIRAVSTTGVALQLVDMLTGPDDVVGEAGAKDGRMDVLLDTGTYKLRSFAAKGATDSVRLLAEPFHDAAPPRALPPPGETFSAELRDGEQRAFWLLVPPGGTVQIEAAGRALAGLRLWRAGRELTALTPAVSGIEPQPGHPMQDLRLSGSVEPGVYLAVAYGGPALPWADGSPAMPFHLRAGLSDALAEGWVRGPVGPFGSERFAAPAFAGVFRLDLPQPEAAELRVDAATATLARTSREPHQTLRGTPGRVGVVEVRGTAGQQFTLRASAPAGGVTVSRQGTYFVSAVTTGTGGDEAPATVLLQRFDAQDPAKIVAGNLPRLAPGAAWRARFNLRGPTAILFQNATGGAVAVRSSGVALRGDAGGQRYDIPADYYVLRLAPVAGAQGALDVTVGSPGTDPPLSLPLPPDPVIPLGVQAVGPGQRLQLQAQTAPGSAAGLSARPVPVALVEGPLFITQAGGDGPVSVPVLVAAGGVLSVRELGGGGVAATEAPGQGGRVVTIPAAASPRTVVLAWRRIPSAPADIPAPPAPGSVTALRAGASLAFDLRRTEERGFALDVPEGGLYRIETLGRLRTKGRLASAFIPTLAEDEASGTGQNMLMQHWLRAGRYRVDVGAVESDGHLSIQASRAPLLQGAALMPGGSVRATLPAGTGAAFPLRVAQDGTYHLDLAGLGHAFTARLDDAGGWPVTRPGEVTALDQALRPGTYRLLVSPEPVERRVAARLAAVLPPVAIEGHGPHALPFATPQSATWREPADRNAPRTPDGWTFALAGPADVSLTLSDGMAADLRRVGGPGDRPLARVAKRWSGRLEAGEYRLDASSLGRNDRLDYTLALEAKELQPGESRTVTLPATIPFTLARDRVASVTSWGIVPVKAVLRRADGTEVVRVGARADDWNIALSRLLPAGSYRLEVMAAAPPSDAAATPQDPGVAAPPDEDSESSSPDEDKPDQDDQQAQSTPRRPRSDSSAETPDTPEQTVELRLELPAALAPVDPPASPLTGAGVHVVRLPQPQAGALLAARASSEGAVVLALERQEGQSWRVVALDEGRAPFVAAMADNDPRPWRIEAWSIDGAAAPVSLAVRTVPADAQAAGPVALRAVEGLNLAAAFVRLDGPGVFAVSGADRAAAWPGHEAVAVEAGQVLAQDAGAWLLGTAPGPATLAPYRLQPGVAGVVAVPGGGVAALPAQTAGAGRLLVWRAESGLGQPGLANGARQGGVAAGSALIAADQPVTLRNAGGPGALRVRTSLLDLALLPAQPPGMLTVPAGSAVPVQLPKEGLATVTLAPGMAALGRDSVAWAGDAPLTRSFAAADQVLLVNTGPSAAPAALAWTEPAPAPGLRPGMVVKRFYGAAGSFALAVEAGGQLAVAGDARLVWQGADGTVRRGRSLAAGGAGRVTVAHGAGPVVLSLSGPGASPWPDEEPVPAAPPQSLALSGPAMALSLAPDGPVLLHAATTAPVLLGLGGGAPELFPAGAEFHRALPAGNAVLRLFSPHDGPLSGTLTLAAEPIRPIAEGLGETVAVAPGHSAAFGFTLARPATVGLGVRAEPDRVEVRLLDAKGAELGQGVAQLRTLPAGRYVIEARVPPDAAPSLVRPAVLGITPRGNGPPPDVAQHYLELVGLKPVDATR